MFNSTFRLFLVTLFVGTIAYPVSPIRADQSVYRKVLPSSVWIIRPGQNTGSGVLVDAKRRWIVTNYHVVQESDKVLVFFAQSNKGRVIAEEGHYVRNAKRLALQGRVIARSKTTDLAIVELNRLPPAAKEVKLAFESPRQGEAVHLVANQSGSGALWTYTDGKVRSVLRFRHPVQAGSMKFNVEAQTVITSLAANPGDSGGPVVNDEGELVAVVSSGKNGARLVCYCIDITEINGLLQKTKVGGRRIDVAAGSGTLIPNLIGGQRTDPARASQSSLVGLWATTLRAKDGGRIGVGLEMKVDGTFELAMSQNGKTASTKGTWQRKAGRLTFNENGRVLMSGQLQVNSPTSWTLINGGDRQTFTRVAPRKQVGNPIPPARRVGQPQTPAPKFSLTGTWSARLTLPDGKGVGVGLQINAGGTFSMTLVRLDREPRTIQGTWQQQADELTLKANGRQLMAGRVQINDPTSWTLVNGKERLVFNKFVERRKIQRPQPVQPRPARLQLGGTTWSGSETLENFGALTFQFLANGTAIMIDTAGRSQGTWTLQGNQVTIRFNNGQIVYVGTVSGNTMTGGAANSKGGSWRFTLKQGNDLGA
ncbi:MAG: trypsin-like peptidase domain-containing protein [Gemmataceae bacterium]